MSVLTWLRAHRVGVAFFAILAIGIFLRLWQFPTIPVGLNQDEISAAYEAKSLLATGEDRWGERWPAYFLSWGSGQNVLYSYLSIPVIWLLGPTTLAIRLVAVIFGIATLPLMFAVVRPYAGAVGGLVAMGFTAIAPWSFMMARWGVESNLLPFWLILGVYLVDRAIRRDRPLGVVLSLLPFAVALYAYGVAAIVFASFLPMLVISLRSDLRRRIGWWLGAAGTALVVAIPFLLFLVKSEVLHRNLPFESLLPFSLPTLTITRLAQLAHESTHGGTWALVGGLLYDNQPEDTLPGLPPLSAALLALSVVGFVFAVIRAVRSRGRRMSPFALMVVASVPLFVVLPNVIDTRVNAVFLPLIALAATGLIDILALAQLHRVRFVLVGFALIGVLATSVYAVTVYFSPEYTTYAAGYFYPGYGTAIKQANRISGNHELYITQYPQLSYMQVLWYLDIPSRTFQASHPTPADPDFGHFVFARKRIDKSETFYYLVSTTHDRLPCSHPTTLWSRENWAIGRCG